MQREQVLEILQKAYARNYDCVPVPDDAPEELAQCFDFRMENIRYVVSEKHALWKADSNEFCYVFSTEKLTVEQFVRFRDYVKEKGLAKIDLTGNHMCTNLTLMIICDTCDAEAKKALKHCRIHKEFRFGLGGWMDYHTALLELTDRKVSTNFSGHDNAKILKQILRTDADRKG